MRNDLLSRFQAKFQKGTRKECWEWNGAKHPYGYGVIQRGQRGQGLIRAHRLAYELHYGIMLPAGQSAIVMHTCDNPGCVNPHHLMLGSMQDNTNDKEQKGRGNHPVGEAFSSAVLTEKKVLALRKKLASGVPVKQLARKLGLNRETLRMMHKGKTWKHVP